MKTIGGRLPVPHAPAPHAAPPAETPAVRGFLRVLPSLLALLAVGWVAITAVIFAEGARHWNDVKRMSELSRARAEYSRRFRDFTRAAELFKNGSDDLTKAARRYAATGRRTFLDAYFEETDGTRQRDRAVAIVDSYAELVGSNKVEVIHEAMRLSRRLQNDEYRAMRLVADATAEPRASLPPAVAAIRLDEEQAALAPIEKRARAIDILYGDAYFKTKAEIWANVDEVLEFRKSTAVKNENLTAEGEDETAAEMLRSLTRQLVLFTVALALVFTLLLLAASLGYRRFARLTRENARLVGDLRRERDATRAAEIAKSRFFSMVSHDIRTPLNSIIGFAELLRQGVDDPKERAAQLEQVHFSAHTLLALVNDVLDLSKLDADKMVFDPEPTDFPGLVRAVAASFRPQADAKGIVVRAEAGAMPILRLDEARQRQILVNLVNNAVKFTEKGEVVLRASFEPAPDGLHGTLRLSVRDTGSGISEKDAARVFEPFEQAMEQTSYGARTAHGTGLGLSICRRILEKMGGSIRLESVLGKGSEFFVEIPGVAICGRPLPAAAASSELRPAAAGTADGRQPTAGNRHAARPSGEGAPAPSVLVVDDVPVNLLVEKAMLAKIGVRDVETVESGAAALAALEKRAYDVVLTDLWMPEMDGEALCARLRADPRWAALPIYAVTADVEARKTAQGKGFTGILLKPLTQEVLRGALGSGA